MKYLLNISRKFSKNKNQNIIIRNFNYKFTNSFYTHHFTNEKLLQNYEKTLDNLYQLRKIYNKTNQKTNSSGGGKMA